MKIQMQVRLKLDAEDAQAVIEAMRRRSEFKYDNGGTIMPPGDSNSEGAPIAEICRGWMEMLDARK